MANTKDTAAGKTYSYAIAKEVLSDTEKNRILCLFLNTDHSGVRQPFPSPLTIWQARSPANSQPQIDWKKATEAFDCASVESMRVMTRSTLKKITDAEKNGGVPTPTKGKGAAGKKRKAAAAAADGEDDAEVPVKKGKGGGKKKVDSPVEGTWNAHADFSNGWALLTLTIDDEEEAGKSGVKEEDQDEF